MLLLKLFIKICCKHSGNVIAWRSHCFFLCTVHIWSRHVLLHFNLGYFKNTCQILQARLRDPSFTISKGYWYTWYMRIWINLGLDEMNKLSAFWFFGIYYISLYTSSDISREQRIPKKCYIYSGLAGFYTKPKDKFDK